MFLANNNECNLTLAIHYRESKEIRSFNHFERDALLFYTGFYVKTISLSNDLGNPCDQTAHILLVMCIVGKCDKYV